MKNFNFKIIFKLKNKKNKNILLILTHSSTLIARGFSQNTCFLAFNAFRACSKCKQLIEAMQTHLIS